MRDKSWLHSRAATSRRSTLWLVIAFSAVLGLGCQSMSPDTSMAVACQSYALNLKALSSVRQELPDEAEKAVSHAVWLIGPACRAYRRGTIGDSADTLQAISAALDGLTEIVRNYVTRND